MTDTFTLVPGPNGGGVVSLGPPEFDALVPKHPELGATEIYIHTDQGAVIRVVFPPGIKTSFEGGALKIVVADAKALTTLSNWLYQQHEALAPFTVEEP